MRTRNVVREDRRSKYGLLVGLKEGLEDRIVGDSPASGFGKLLHETLGIRPDDISIDDYFTAIEEKMSGPLAERLRHIYSGLKENYDLICDDGDISAIQGEYVLADGKEYHVHFSFHKKTVFGKELIELIIRDDSHTKKVEQGLRNVEQGLRMLIDFILHDAKSYLTPASVALELIQRVGLPEKVQVYIGMAARGVETATGFFNTNLVNLTTGEFSIDKTPHNLTQMVENAYEFVNLEAEKKGIKINYDMPINATIQIDDKLQMALGNVFENAIKYSPSGSTISCKLEYVQTDEEAVQTDEEGHYKLSIRNPGKMSQDDATKLFDRSYRASGTGQGGYGLGLYNARNIVRSNGGKIYAITDEKRYVEIVLELPKK